MHDTPLENRILSALPEAERAHIQPDIQRISLPLRRTVHEPGQPIERVYFPVDSVLSVITLMQNGDAVEIGTIGKEGFSGTTIALNSVPQSETICQVAGDSDYMESARFLVHLEKQPVFRKFIQHYAAGMFNFLGQSIACNRLHSLNERCARWLLLTHDRVGKDEFYLTQEFLAMMMLGVSRPAVTVAAGALQEAGMISFHRGNLKVVDRARLEAASCECYELNVKAMTLPAS